MRALKKPSLSVMLITTLRNFYSYTGKRGGCGPGRVLARAMQLPASVLITEPGSGQRRLEPGM
jgi:hypothetical protein